MGNRRMLSKNIVSSAKFIKMPPDTQNLYFHLVMAGDDDGVVEAYTTMRLIGSHEDSLKLLVAKQFVRVLNDDLVTHITDWNEHNTIRADRKVDSVYKDLLLEIVPDIKLIEPKQRSDRPTSNGTSQGQPTDGVSKDKISKDKISNTEKLLQGIETTEDGMKILEDFIAYRKQIKSPIKTQAGLNRFLNDIRKISEDGYNMYEAIELMKSREWKTVTVEFLKNTGLSNSKTLQHERVSTSGLIY